MFKFRAKTNTFHQWTSGNAHYEKDRNVTLDNISYPLISVIVAVLNGAKTIQQCINSISGQSYEKIEIIIIDGDSSDGTVDILKKNTDHLSYWESKKDRGIAHAWNKALDIAKGDWSLFLGSDDWLDNEQTIETFVPCLKRYNDDDLVFGKVTHGKAGVVYGGPWLPKRFLRRMTIPHQACFHGRKLFDRVNRFDENYKIGMDYELLLRAGPLRVHFCPIMVTQMGGYGLSSALHSVTLAEFRRAQIRHKVAPRLFIEAWHVYRCTRRMLRVRSRFTRICNYFITHKKKETNKGFKL